MSSQVVFQAACPSCGAPVTLASSASPYAVCEHCNSTLARDGDTLSKLGKVSAVLEDYSPLQVGTSGVWQGRAFTLIGRVQMTYPGGFWNEWHALFDDGQTAWLSDASGQYAVTLAKPLKGPVSTSFGSATPGSVCTIDGVPWIVSDRREAGLSGAQGQLPFKVASDWSARVVDLRHGSALATLDFSGPPLQFFEGELVTLASLKLQNTRDDETIAASAGRIKGKISSVACAQCGSSVPVVAGGTPVSTCGSCGALLQQQGKVSAVMKAGTGAAAVASTFLKPGDSGVLLGDAWTVLGVVLQRASIEGESFTWTEYLLFSTKNGFRWLSQTDSGWLFARVLDTWPTDLKNETFALYQAKFYDPECYTAEVERVWGSFNWEIHVGDRVSCADFALLRTSPSVPPDSVLVRETTDSEQLWSLCIPLKERQVLAAFNKSSLSVSAPEDESSIDDAATDSGLSSFAQKALIANIFIIVIIGFTVLGLLLGLASLLIAIFLPRRGPGWTKAAGGLILVLVCAHLVYALMNPHNRSSSSYRSFGGSSGSGYSYSGGHK